MKTFTTIARIAALTSYASAHVAMQQPVPYNPTPDTSPLVADGSNYPCKTTGSFTVNTQNTAAVGSTVKMTFTGSAVHNGGSCQVSLTKDANPTANSQFKVIYSILGGCPGTNGMTTSYDVPIPSDVPAGDYTYTWTWFNNIGDREMYMNCAPMTITGGSGTDDTFNALPDTAVYNIASKNTCKTVETFDVDFPNPGKYVLKGAAFKPQAPTCDGTDLGTGTSTGSSNSTSPNSGSSGASALPATPTTSANNGQYTGIGAASGSQGGGAGTGASPSSAQSASNGQSTGSSNSTSSAGTGSQPQVAAPSAASSSSSPTAQAPAAISTPSAGGSNGTFSSPSPTAAAGSSSGAACSPDGSLVCSTDGSQFALCNHGSALMMPVAAGTKCLNGAIQKKRRDISVKMPFLFKA